MLSVVSRLNTRIFLRKIHFYRQHHKIGQKSSQNYCRQNKLSRFLSYTMAQANSNADHKHVNRLIDEKSPYLLQHAHNPVNWYPWGNEAIQLAKKEDKLIFLSIGYSTCHWCHVMEKESFEDEETAKIMNEKFINIKVDREERPEIDKLYMTFILLINGSGGWPLSIFLTPDLSPVTGGTYFPPNDRWGMPGFKTILTKVANKWETSRADLLETGQSVIEAIQKTNSQKKAESDSHDDHHLMSIEDKFYQAINIYKRVYDRELGGTKGSPKFPEVSKLNFLFHAFVQTRDDEVLDIALTTLDKIASGGIHDHVFGGFSRYSVDKKWHVPHFEKMLYDQGQLLQAYSNAYKITRDKKYLEIAHKTFKYLCTDLRHPAGGFYAGEDADSYPTYESKDKIEGAFYAWEYNEIKKLFEENQDKFVKFKEHKPFDIYTYHYDIKKNGNVEPASDPHGHIRGKNILFVKGSINETADKFSTSVNTIEAILNIGNEILNIQRQKRPRPHLDCKIVTAWNGLLLIGLSKIACISDNPLRHEYLNVGKKLIEFVKEYLYDEKKKKLLRVCYAENNESQPTRGAKHIYGFLDDYAFFIKGLIYFYVASLDISYLHFAKELQELQDKYFWDTKNSAYFYSEASQSDVVVRMKEDHDGAEPAGNSVSVQNLTLLSSYFEEQKFKEKAVAICNYYSNVSPMGYALPEMLSSLLLEDIGLHMLVVVGPDNEKTRELIDVASDYYVPGLLCILLLVDRPHEVTRKSVSQFKMVKDLPTAYCCHNKRCTLPITDVKLLHKEFEKYLRITKQSNDVKN
ncbi:hypothetical protein PVAND_009832 [Polypedilum vanderplanki]|uniref:Spermatogenesis-associated protein 20-like TRX domain-containing protein n=1 Tax=Polypedilum vanderplanki TaxID=319348 RepID=A0A9J6CET0_POLVA|nr:hypothetical protein PVAND_009832 [Polypedilum vanderplanki]